MQTITRDPLVIAGVELRSRLFLGTGKYPTDQATVDALEASGGERGTAALRRPAPLSRHTAPRPLASPVLRHGLLLYFLVTFRSREGICFPQAPWHLEDEGQNRPDLDLDAMDPHRPRVIVVFDSERP